MSLEQANRYYELAAKARQQGRNSIADALLRQAEREKEKSAMDVADVANIQRERANAQQNVAQPQQPVVETPATDVPVAEAEQPASTVPWSEKPAQPAPPVKPAPYKPTAEELANMEDSGMYNVAIPQGNGVRPNPNAIDSGANLGTDAILADSNAGVKEDPWIYPGMDNTGDVIASTQQTEPDYYGIGGSFDGGSVANVSPNSYNANTYGGAPSEGDMYWNTPAEIRANNERKKRQRFLDLMNAANRANL